MWTGALLLSQASNFVMRLYVCLQVLPLPDELLVHHATLYEDYKNVTHWPKHVMVHYHWLDEGDIDFNRGLYVLMITGQTHEG